MPKITSLTPRRLSLPARLLVLFVMCFAVVWAADYVMKPGDTLFELAKQRYGDGSYWTALKWYNGIGNVYSIPVGTPINFPDKATLDQVNTVIKPTAGSPPMSPAERSAAIVALGGTANPVPQKNAGAGREIHYGALSSLALPQVRSR